jgi:aminoglycoside phosphotransferase (APT) family kinase protein
VGAAVDLVDQLYERTWPELAERRDVTPAVRDLGTQLLGRVTEFELASTGAGPLTLVHGDASLANMRSSADGEIALLDWEDVSAAPGLVDLAWLLVSSVEPARWQDVIAAYGPAAGLTDVLPAAAVQGLLSLSDSPEGSAEAAAWVARIAAAAARLQSAP